MPSPSSHCHHDHVGTLPVAIRHFPKAHILMTELSYFLIGRVLHNSVNVMIRQRDENGVRDYPLYTHHELEDMEPRFQGFRYNRQIEWSSHAKARAGPPPPPSNFTTPATPSAPPASWFAENRETLFYTGDVCFHDQTILKAARFSDIRADVLIMETTRGDRATPPGFTREAEAERLAQAMERVLATGGCILIPTFALGRTQEILAQLALMIAADKLRRQPIYIGGLGRVFTEIYDLKAHLANRGHPNLRLLRGLATRRPGTRASR